MEVQHPDFEVIVRVNASDVVVAAGFIVAQDEMDILLGIEKPTDVPRYKRIIEFVLAAFDDASWKSLDELGVYESDDGDTDAAIPF